MKAGDEIKNLRENIQKTTGTYSSKLENYAIFDQFPLNSKQCLYVANWRSRGIVYEKGLENLTGYTLKEFNTEDIIAYTHPEDRELVKNITTGVVSHVISTPIQNKESHLLLSFRFLKKDGSYCKILVQSSVLERDEEGKMISNFSLLTDISFIETHDRVEWEFHARELDLIAFKKVIYNLYRDFYTKREKEIINLIAKKYTSKEIANQLCLSKLTVQTHRKNILRKAKSHSIDDVLSFCKKNGIIG
ncbi:LuxR C-terminal-related transcriptional regulator [uncultured Maribacter sp.]|uniref:LuxR C-terminal-related transcriptional regulator n=1 Tax=uncultured Maribacter sp. TaxID=431308 RepID=UPI0026295769|nr:LuxR C-terminal-related transcriptional regulator [uncultured Maribacter sp.]